LELQPRDSYRKIFSPSAFSFFWLWDIDDESYDENQRINKNEKL